MSEENEKKTDAGRQEALNKLRTSPELFVLISLCTKMPYVMCDPETFDDEIFLYEKEEDVKKEAVALVQQKIPVHVAKIENQQFLNFYANLYTMGVNCIVYNWKMDSEVKLQLPELVRRPGIENLPEGKIWVENPSLHLTALYFMQEVRKQKLEKLTPELKEMQDEILADYGRGTFLAAVHEENGVPLMKQKNGDSYQPIFTDALEFRKFNKDNKFRAVVVKAQKVVDVLAKEAKGVVINPMGVNLQLPVVRRNQPQETAPGETPNKESAPAPKAAEEKPAE